VVASPAMSALGHKRTFAVQNAMSALPPKADILQRHRHVRYRAKSFERSKQLSSFERPCSPAIDQRHAAGTDHHPEDRYGVQAFVEKDVSHERGHNRHR
jgi:hypothetical protein